MKEMKKTSTVFNWLIFCIFILAPVTFLACPPGPQVDIPVVPSWPVINNGNIEFGQVDPSWTQEEMTAKLAAGVRALNQQSWSIRRALTDIVNAELSQGSSNSPTLSFARNLIATQIDQMNYYYSGNAFRNTGTTGVNQIRSAATTYNNESDSLWNARVVAFRQALLLNGRTDAGLDADSSSTSRANEEASLQSSFNSINWAGGQVPEGELSEVIATLRSQISGYMSGLPHGMALLQQMEDTAQWNAFTRDAWALGYNLAHGIPEAELNLARPNRSLVADIQVPQEYLDEWVHAVKQDGGVDLTDDARMQAEAVIAEQGK